MELYKIVNFPFLLGNGNVAHFKDDEKVVGLAVNPRRNTYRLLSADEFAACAIQHTHSCAAQAYEYKNGLNKNCIYSYFMKNKQQVLKHCIAIPYEHPADFKIEELAQNMFFYFFKSQ